MSTIHVKETVFGSKIEQSVYYKLLEKWGKAYNLYLSLPVANIFHVDLNELKPGEKKTYLQSSIDYTFCSKIDKPLFSVEFDGLGNGYSRGNEYIQTKSFVSDPYRKVKLEFKLKMASSAGYPFVVVSYDEVTKLDEDETLTILDGIVGQLTSKRRFEELLTEFIANENNNLNSMTPMERDEYVKDCVTSLEVEAELESDPIAIKAAEYQREILKYGVTGYITESLEEPGLPQANFPPKTLKDIESLKNRIRALKDITKYGYKISIKTYKGLISRSFWVREYKPYGISSIVLAQNIAELLAFKDVLKVLSGSSKTPLE